MYICIMKSEDIKNSFVSFLMIFFGVITSPVFLTLSENRKVAQGLFISWLIFVALVTLIKNLIYYNSK